METIYDSHDERTRQDSGVHVRVPIKGNRHGANQDERQQRIELTHQTITNLLPWLCQKMGHPGYQNIIDHTPSDIQMSPASEKRGLITPPDSSRKKVCQNLQEQRSTDSKNIQEGPPVMGAGAK